MYRIFIFLMLMTTIAQADVYVVTAPDKSVYSVSEQDDAVVPSGYKKTVVKNKFIKDFPLDSNEKMYDFSGTKFTLNSKKVTDKNKAEQEAIIASQKRATDKATAISKLKALGLTESEIETLQ